MIGQTVSHYKILEHLGGGGMGVVYKAQDLKLDRLVALKFLPPDLARDPQAKQRFLDEAKAASALDHVNICTIHDIGESDDGQIFIVMALYKGETLKNKIEQGPLKIDEAIELAMQVAQGLTTAHEHGIVHRDIKPANIVVTTAGVAKIVDFGLAKLSGQVRLTRTGSTIGTAAYMSPEQVRGEEVDHRTDIWSLGVVLYEMLTGRLPFKGEHEVALVYSILNTEPEPTTAWRQEIPAALTYFISRMLEKDREDRFQIATEAVSELRRIQRHSDRTLAHQPAASRHASGVIPKPPGTRRRTITTLQLVAALLVAVGAWFIITRTLSGPGALNPALRMRPLNVHFPRVGDPAISADGNWIVFPAFDERGEWQSVREDPRFREYLRAVRLTP